MMKMKSIILLMISFCAINTYSQNTQVLGSPFFLTTSQCYDCRDCRSAYSTNSVKGNFKVEEKYFRILCDGDNAGVISVYRTTECTQESYSCDFINRTFSSESEAKSYLNSLAKEMCAKGEIIVDGAMVNKEEHYKKLAEEERVQKEREDRIRRERNQLLSDFQDGKLKADTIEWDNEIPASTISKDFILSGHWKIFKERLSTPLHLEFLPDGVYNLHDVNAPSGEKDETGSYFINDDNTVTLYRAPIVNIHTKKITIHKEHFSFWERRGTPYVSSSQDRNSRSEASVFMKNLKLQNSQLVGDWHLEVWKGRSDAMDLVFRFEEVGDTLMGTLIHFQMNNEVYCDQAQGAVMITEGSFAKFMVSFDGSCCTGTISELRAHFLNDNQFFGEFYNNYGKPTSCARTLWRTDVKGVKLPEPFDGRLFQKNKKSDKITTASKTKKHKKNRKENDSAKTKTHSSTLAEGFENFDNWTSSNAKISSQDNIISIVPQKKKKPAIFTSPQIDVGSNDNYFRIDIDQSKIKSGHIKVLIKDLESGETEEAFSQKISLSLEEINQQIRDFGTSRNSSNNRKSFKTVKINVREFRSKTIQIIIAYKATGIGKPPLYITDVR